MKTSRYFTLPFDTDEDGIPIHSEITKSGLSVGSLISEFDERHFEYISGVFLESGGDIFDLYVYADNFCSFGKFFVGKTAISHHAEKYSIYNTIFADGVSNNYFFMSGERQLFIFIGTKYFVSKCMSVVNSPMLEAEDVFESYFYSEEQRNRGLEILRLYNKL